MIERLRDELDLPLMGRPLLGQNAAELLGQPNVDGALVGGAALKAEDFLSIVQAGVQLACSGKQS